MSADLCFIMQSAERQPYELPIQRPGDGLAQGRLAHAGRAGKAQDGLAHPRPLSCTALVAQLLHSQVLQDAVLDLLKAVVVRIQRLLRLRDVDRRRRERVPWQAGHPLEIGADHGILGRGLVQLLHARQFALRLFLGLGRQLRLLDLLAQALRLRAVVRLLAQLLADGRELLPQDVLPLRLLHLVLGLALDLPAQLQDLDLPVQYQHEPVHLLGDGVDLQDLLTLPELQADVRRHQVGELARILDVERRRRELLGHVRRERHHLLEQLGKPAHQRLDGDRLFACVRLRRHFRPDERFVLDEPLDGDAFDPLDQHPERAVRRLDHLEDARHRADGVY
ncbi:MAG: hypothetical protein H6Q98_920, partial [Nitrospirae bacterium]|nr:hypothetical protein [Nitrospirota bacterium]